MKRLNQSHIAQLAKANKAAYQAIRELEHTRTIAAMMRDAALVLKLQLEYPERELPVITPAMLLAPDWEKAAEEAVLNINGALAAHQARMAARAEAEAALAKAVN